jgi:hypothetical protein
MAVTVNTVQRHLDEIEHRLGTLEQRIRTLEGLQSDLKVLRELSADCQYEVAELQEA